MTEPLPSSSAKLEVFHADFQTALTVCMIIQSVCISVYMHVCMCVCIKE